ncbi:DegT/DnrJ/EryC1/StrS family aminotransferase [Microbacterium sp. Root180]|uniref:DegT/DnrJ/EryC1/StrS family aminotransferase n=1 Tax=Microbacterium sp. Root180 TaxID=1736483 RepID=UPI001F200093|nr:aminotransferase class I/II-fold pyridoxal phosphate-dependent enzyme [Microbacterium sp. Root180]
MSSPDTGALEEEAVLRALRSGWIAPLGPEVDAFEREVAERVGARFAVALSSGTAGLHLGLLALGVGPGDVVVTSTMTFAATANAIVYTGARPHFVDADPTTGNIDVQLLGETLAQLQADGESVRAVLPVDLLGKAVDYAAIEQLAAEFGVPVLADAAESFGARFHGRPVGSFGRASVFSFNGNKIMTTSGGGMLVTDDAAVADRVRHLATQARLPVSHYEHADIGFNYRLSNILAALGRAQLARFDDMLARRREWRRRYRAFFAEVDGVGIFGGDDDDDDNAWLTAIIVDEGAGWSPAELIAGLAESNIESRPLWKPMHLQPVFASYGATVGGAAERQFRRGVTLPSGSALSEEQFTRVETALRSFLESRA